MSKKLQATSWDMRRLSEGERARAISEKLKDAVDNQCLRGRLCVDLASVLRECDWLVKTIRGLEHQEFTRDQVGSQLACIDVNVRYLSYDIDGLRKSLATLFATTSQGNSANVACPLSSHQSHIHHCSVSKSEAKCFRLPLVLPFGSRPPRAVESA